MGKRTEGRKNSISDAFVFLVFGVFAVSVILVLSLGISSYQKITERDEVTYRERTCAHYIYTKLQQAEDLDRVYIGDADGREALVIEEVIEGETYATKIYCLDGWLMECFTIPDSGVEASAGEKLVPAEDLNLKISDKLIKIDIVTPEDETVSVIYSLDGRKEASL